MLLPSQSAVSGRYLYGMLLQTWLPSSNMTNSAFGAVSAIFFVCSHGISRSSLPVTTSSGWSISGAASLRSSSEALARVSSRSAAPVWCMTVSRVGPGIVSQQSPKLNGPPMPTAALMRFS